MQIRHFPLDDLPEYMEEPVDLGAGTLPILGRERVQCEHAHAEFHARFNDAPGVLGAGPVTRETRQPVITRPPTVAIHDDRNVMRHHVEGRAIARAVGLHQHQISKTSLSLRLPTSSTCAMKVSVSFCSRSWARLTSSSDTCF